MIDKDNKVILFYKYSQFDVFHPLIGKAKLTEYNLRQRSTIEAAKVLHLAKLLAAFRIDKQIEIDSLCRRLTTAPWTGKEISINSPVLSLMTMDLARALLILHPDELIHRLFGTDIDNGFWNVSPQYKTYTEELSRIRRWLPSYEGTMRIEKLWCRNWVMSLNNNPNMAIDIPTLIGSLDREVIDSMGNYIDVYQERIIPNYDYRARVLKSLMASGTNILEAVPSAFYDARCNVQLLNDALLNHPGVFIATHSILAWKTLMNTWTLQAGTHWEIISGITGRPGIWVVKIALDTNSLVSHNIKDRDTYPEIYFDNGDYILNPILDLSCQEELIRIIREINENGQPDPWKNGFAIISTHEACKKLAGMDSPLNNLPLITIPEIQIRDIVPMLIALKPRLEDLRSMAGPKSITLPGIFSILELLEKKEEILFKETIYARRKTGLEPVDTIKWSNRGNVLELFRNGRLNEMHRQDQGKEELAKWRVFFREANRRIDKDLKNFIDEKGFMSIINKYVGSPRRLKEIMEMEKSLDSMCSR